MRIVRNVKSLAWFVAALAAAAFVCGCGSDTRPVKAPPVETTEAPTARTSAALAQSPSVAQSASAVQSPSVAGFKADLMKGNAEIDEVLATLGKLTDPQTPPAELRPTFDAYSDQLARMTHWSEQLRREAEQMRDSRAAYFARWEEKAAGIDNPSIRASAEARKARLRAANDRITTDALAARDAYEPFMRDLRDVRKYLAADLSPSGVQMLGDVSKKANADGAEVKQRVNAVIAELDAVEGSEVR